MSMMMMEVNLESIKDRWSRFYDGLDELVDEFGMDAVVIVLESICAEKARKLERDKQDGELVRIWKRWEGLMRKVYGWSHCGGVV